MSKDYDLILQTINEVISKRTAEKESLENSILQEKNIIEESNRIMLTATQNGELKAYKAAKKNRDEASDSLALQVERLAIIESNSDISNEESEDIIERINSLQTAKLNELKKELRQYLEKINELELESMEYIAQGNELLNTWHTCVKPFRKHLGYNNDKPIYMDAPQVFKEHLKCKSYLNSITRHPQYEAITGNKSVPIEKPTFVI